ncbi:MAG: UUP1 family membrane protein, partial [Woeseiaceae bacterium]
MTKRYVWVLAALLAATSLLMFLYKWQVLGFPLTERQETPAWTVETAIRFDSGPGTIQINLQIPNLTPGFGKLNHYSVSRNFGFGVNYVGGGREAQWTTRRADGTQTLFYRIVVYEDPDNQESDTTPPFPIPPVIDEPERTAVDILVTQVREHSAEAASFTSELLRIANRPSPDPNVGLIFARARTRADFVDVLTMILASARVPARRINGILLQDQQRDADPVPWLEIHDSFRWRYFNPDTGEEGLPDRYLIWWRGSDPLYTANGVSNVHVDFAVQKNYIDSIAIAEQRAELKQSKLFDFSLFSLPIRTQAVYSVLLTIPIGALVMVIMRNVIGIDSFGTFMPVLIALAFRETQLLYGV